jgi:hypothetical protein
VVVVVVVDDPQDLHEAKAAHSRRRAASWSGSTSAIRPAGYRRRASTLARGNRVSAPRARGVRGRRAVQGPARGRGWAALFDGDERHPVVAEHGAADGQPLGVVTVEVVGQGFALPPADAARVGCCPAVQPVAQGDPTRRPARPAVDEAEIKEEVLLIDRVVGPGIGLVGAEPRPGLPLSDLPLVVGLRDPHRPQPISVELAARVHEPRPARHPAAQSAILPPEQEQRVPTSVSQRHQQPAVLGELRCPLRGHVGAAHRGHDAVERCPLGNAIEAVAAQHRDPGIPGTGQQPPSLRDHVLAAARPRPLRGVADGLGHGERPAVQRC